MLNTIKEIFDTNSIQVNSIGDRIPLHSHTSIEQGVFLQRMFDIVKPLQSLEVGFAYGISAMFILEKHREIQSKHNAHLVIEPDNYWGNAAIFNIEKEGLIDFLQIKNGYSDTVLTKLFHEEFRLQFAYIDTTKQFDVVMQDFYFINKMMDCGGIVILDDCGGNWPGIQRVARFINTLPNFKMIEGHNKNKVSFKKKAVGKILAFVINLLPFKQLFYPTINFKTDEELGLDYSCIAFQKLEEDSRNWNWDKPF